MFRKQYDPTIFLQNIFHYLPTKLILPFSYEMSSTSFLRVLIYVIEILIDLCLSLVFIYARVGRVIRDRRKSR